jgi:hypothetical protein
MERFIVFFVKNYRPRSSPTERGSCVTPPFLIRARSVAAHSCTRSRNSGRSVSAAAATNPPVSSCPGTCRINAMMSGINSLSSVADRMSLGITKEVQATSPRSLSAFPCRSVPRNRAREIPHVRYEPAAVVQCWHGRVMRADSSLLVRRTTFWRWPRLLCFPCSNLGHPFTARRPLFRRARDGHSPISATASPWGHNSCTIAPLHCRTMRQLIPPNRLIPNNSV